MKIQLYTLTVEPDSGSNASYGELISYSTLVMGWPDIKALATKGTDAVGRKIVYMDLAFESPHGGKQPIVRYTPETLADLP